MAAAAGNLSGHQPGDESGAAVFLQVFQFLRPAPHRPLPGGLHSLVRPRAGHHFAGGHLILYLPDPQLHHRRLPGKAGPGAGFRHVRPICLLFPPVGGRAHRAGGKPPAPAEGGASLLL